MAPLLAQTAAHCSCTPQPSQTLCWFCCVHIMVISSFLYALTCIFQPSVPPVVTCHLQQFCVAQPAATCCSRGLCLAVCCVLLAGAGLLCETIVHVTVGVMDCCCLCVAHWGSQGRCFRAGAYDLLVPHVGQDLIKQLLHQTHNTKCCSCQCERWQISPLLSHPLAVSVFDLERGQVLVKVYPQLRKRSPKIYLHVMSINLWATGASSRSASVTGENTPLVALPSSPPCDTRYLTPKIRSITFYYPLKRGSAPAVLPSVTGDP